jgi:hypothetical protein
MAKRYIGDAVITIEYVGETPDGRGNYKGTVRVGKHTWRFDELHSGVGGVSSGRGYGYPADSPEAYDEMAQSAVSFASYYTTHNRGDDVPEWAPPPEVADAIDEAVSIVLRDDGTYEVRRSPEGKVREDAVMHEVSESSLVRDYEAVDHRGRVVGGPYKDYDRAKREAERARGHVRFAPSAMEREHRPGFSPSGAPLPGGRAYRQRLQPPRLRLLPHPRGALTAPLPAPSGAPDRSSMARKTHSEPPPENDDHKRGSDYAAEQIAGQYFQDWVWDQMVEAERMRQSDPSSVLPIETKAHALKIARNMFQQLTWDTKREVSESKEFFEGFEEMLDSQKEWLAEMVLDFNREAREKTGTLESRDPQPVQDPFYVIQAISKGGAGGGHVDSEFGFDEEDVAIREAKKLLKAPWFESDYVRIITRDGELVWTSDEKASGPPVAYEARRTEVLTPEQRDVIVAALRHYGADLSSDGFITHGGKVLSVRPEVKKGRLRMISTDGSVQATYPASNLASGVADFVESFWYWKPASGAREAAREAKHNLYVWQISLQVTSPDRPNLKHEIQFRVQAPSNAKAEAIDKAKELAARDGYTVVSVTGAARGYMIKEQQIESRPGRRPVAPYYTRQ